MSEEPAGSDLSAKPGDVRFDPVNGLVVFVGNSEWVPVVEKPDLGPGFVLRDR